MTGSDVIWQSAEKRGRRTPILVLTALALFAVGAMAGRAFWSSGGFREPAPIVDAATVPVAASGKSDKISTSRRLDSPVGSSVAPRANPPPRDSAPPRHAPLPRSD